MEEPQKTPEPKREDDQAAPARSAAKVIRAGVEAKAGQNPLRGVSGDGGDQGPVSAPAAAAAVPILRAGRQTLELPRRPVSRSWKARKMPPGPLKAPMAVPAGRCCGSG